MIILEQLEKKTEFSIGIKTKTMATYDRYLGQS